MYFDPIETGKRIKKLREACGYTQESFAEELNASRNYIAKVEIGYRAASIDMLAAIAVLTESTLDYLVFGKGIEPAYERAEVKSELKEIMKALSDLQEKL